MSSPTPVNIVMDAFDSSFVLTEQGLLPDLSYTLDVSAEITLTQRVKIADISGFVFFKSATEITEPTEFFVDQTKIQGGAVNTLNPMNGIVTSNYYGTNSGDHLAKDFLRDMSQHLFNTHFAVDLFTNEDEVVSDISNLSLTQVAQPISTLIGNVDKTNTSLPHYDPSYGYHTTEDDQNTTNIGREVLHQLLTLSLDRFDDARSLRRDPDISGVYILPLVAGDTFSYKLSVSSHPNQNTEVNTGKSALNPRTYRVKLIVEA